MIVEGNNDNYNEPQNITNNNNNDMLNYDSISEKNIRGRFISKVYGIISFQLIITFGMVCYFMVNQEAMTNFVVNNIWLYYVSVFVTFVSMYALICSGSLSREVPINYILLTIFTVCISYSVSIICLDYDVEDVFIASLITFAITVSLSIYAKVTTTDFTIYLQILFSILCCFIICSIILFFFPNKLMEICLSYLGAVIYSIYIIIDTQLLLGKHGTRVSIDDYIFIAMNLYLDIINLFIEILKIIGDRKK